MIKLVTFIIITLIRFEVSVCSPVCGCRGRDIAPVSVSVCWCSQELSPSTAAAAAVCVLMLQLLPRRFNEINEGLMDYVASRGSELWRGSDFNKH